MSDSQEFVFTWNIVNIAMLPRELESNQLCSPSFNVKKFFDTEWRIELDINSFYLDSHKCISALLRRNADRGPKSVEIYFEVSMGSSQEVRNVTGQYKFCQMDTYKLEWLNPTFQDNVCIIVCHMRVISYELEKESRLPTIAVLPCSIKTELLSEEAANELRSVVETNFPGLKESACQLPDSCFAETIIDVETRSVTCSMKKILNLEVNEEDLLPILSCSLVPDLLLRICKTLEDEVEYLEVQLVFVGRFEYHLSLVTKIKMVDQDGKSHGFGEGFHSHKTPSESTVLFKKLLRWSEIEQYKNSKLKFETLIAFERHCANIKYSHAVDYFQTELSSRTEPLQFGREENSQYVKLRSGEKTFEAPKNVLCAMSPVFEAMFQSGMQESITDQVYIKDLESDTIESMLAFFDNGNLDELELEGVFNLYHAAAKYQISELTVECRNVLLKNLVPENIGDVLSIADTYQDTKLRNCTVRFLSEHRAAVFRSEEWKSFADKNPHLGLQILKQICNEYL